MRRKLMSIFVVVALLCGIVSPALAQGETGRISQDQAIKIARDMLAIPENLKNISMSYREESYPFNKRVWEFMWDDSKNGKWHGYRVEVDADTGEIISFYEDQDWNQYVKPKKSLSQEECKDIAEKFLKKISPDRFNQVKEIVRPGMERGYQYGPKRYDFSYHRVVNGILFPDNSLNISVNADNGKIMNYYSNWDSSISIPKASPVVTSDEAEKIFREKVGLRLSYMLFGYTPTAVKKPIGLYYTMTDNYAPSAMIDAVTGDLVDAFGKEVNVQSRVYLTPKPEPLPVEDDGRTITVEEAKAKVKEYVTIPDNYNIRSTRYSEGWGPGAKKVWEFDFGPSDFKGGATVQVTVNATTGELISFSRWEDSYKEISDHKAGYDYDTCSKIATEFLKKMAPQKADYVYLVQPTTKPFWYSNGKIIDPPVYNFNFVRVVNGVPFAENQIGIDVDNTTGEVRGFWSNWDENLKFAETAPVISEQEAIDKLFAVERPTLVYTYKQNENGAPSRELMLVYRMFNDIPKVVKADNGKVVSLYELENPIILEDIRGHWAESDINTLASWGIIAGSGNKYNPDQTITRAEFVTMLVRARGLDVEENVSQTFKDVSSGDWYFGSVEAAFKAGLVQGSDGKFYPNKTITRQEMVVMLMNALNSGQVQVSDHTLSQFKDETKIAGWAKEKMAQAVEMGIVAGSDGYLKPNDLATRAQAASVLMKAISGDKMGHYATKRIYLK